MRAITIHFICLFLGGYISAQDLFLFHGKSCVDRYEYRFIEKNINLDYIAYVVHPTSGALIHLEVGVENDNATSYLPGKLSSCNSINWSQQLIEEINAGKVKLSIVSKEDKKYYTSPVSIVTVINSENGLLSMYGSGYDFTSSLNEPVGQLNLGKEGSNSDVFYKGDLSFYNCPAYQFVRLPRVACKAFTECTIVPGIGIVEERTGIDVAEADDNVLRLTGINNISIDNYIYNKGCNPTIEIRVEMPVSYSQPVQREAPLSNPREWAYVPDIEEANMITTKKEAPSVALVNPCLEVPAAGSHIVQSGENLYAIARKYGLTVGLLREWNKIPNDIIRPCQRLTLTAPFITVPLVVESKKEGAAIAPKPKSKPAPKPAVKKAIQPALVTTTKKQVTVKKTEVPKSYSNTTVSAKSVAPVPQLWKTNKGFHTVKQGETLSLLAKMYGFSIDRLKEMNDLKTTDIMAGQILKINDCVCDADKSGGANSSTVTTTVNTASVPASYSTSGAGSRLKKTVVASEVPAGAPSTEIVSSGATTTVYRSDVLTEKGSVVHYHTVSEGETLFSIAKMYNTTVDVLRSRNDLDPYEVLIIGQQLVVK